mmetsp:Transcript_9029/g.21363  ORF Transcript_9029/g.21363 Transcript_9029/m.21363 type:complete len:295 (+) Transcript_9029:300-1184(+)
MGRLREAGARGVRGRHLLEEVLEEERVLHQALDGLDQKGLEREAVATGGLHLRREEGVELRAALPAAAQRLEAELVVLAVGRVQLEKGRHRQEGARDHSHHVAAAVGALERLQRLEQRRVAPQQVLDIREDLRRGLLVDDARAHRVHEDVDDGLQVGNVRRLRLVHLAAHEHDLRRRLHRLLLILCAHGRPGAGRDQIHRRCRNRHWRSRTGDLSMATAVLDLIKGNAQAPCLLGRVAQLQHVSFGLVKDSPDILVARVLGDLVRRGEVRLVASAVVARIVELAAFVDGALERA